MRNGLDFKQNPFTAITLLAALVALGLPLPASAEFTRKDIPASRDCAKDAKELNDHIMVRNLGSSATNARIPVTSVADVKAYCQRSFAAPMEHFEKNRSTCWAFLEELKAKVGVNETYPGTLRAAFQAACDATKKWDFCHTMPTGAKMQECVARASFEVAKAEAEKVRIAEEVGQIITRYGTAIVESLSNLNAARSRLSGLGNNDIRTIHSASGEWNEFIEFKNANGKTEIFSAADYGVSTISEARKILGAGSNSSSDPDYGRLIREASSVHESASRGMGLAEHVRRDSGRVMAAADQAHLKATGRYTGLSTITGDKDKVQAYRDNDRALDRPPQYYPPPAAAPQAGGGGGASGGAGGAGTPANVQARNFQQMDAQRKLSESKGDAQKDTSLVRDTKNASLPGDIGSSDPKTAAAPKEESAKTLETAGQGGGAGNVLDQPGANGRADSPYLGRAGANKANPLLATAKGGALTMGGGGAADGSKAGDGKGCKGSDCAADPKSEGRLAEGGEGGKGGGVPGFEGGASSEKGDDAKGGGKAADKDKDRKGKGDDELSPMTAEGPKEKEKDLNKTFAALDAIFDQVAGKSDPKSKDAAAKDAAKGASAIDVKELVDEGGGGKPAATMLAEIKALPAAVQRKIAQAGNGDVVTDNFDGDLGLDMSLFERVSGYYRRSGEKRMEK